MLNHRNDLAAIGIDARPPRMDVVFLGDLTRRNFAITVFRDHRERSAREVAEAAREVGVGTLDEILI